MRNDARPIGHENSRQSPVVSRQSEVVSHQSEVDGRQSQAPVDQRLPDLLDLDGDDPVMPADDSTLNTRI